MSKKFADGTRLQINSYKAEVKILFFFKNKW